MKYVNAKAVLPHHLVEELQEYIQAGYIYIPAREDRHKAWGEQSGCRRELTERNAGIVDAYRQGVSLEELGISTVFLSTPYEKLYIRSKPWGAAVRGSLFRQV